MSKSWSEVISSFREHLQHNQAIIAAGAFGSVSRGQDWVHSDLDVLAIVDCLDTPGEAVYCRWQGKVVHSQLLPVSSLKAALSRNNYAFLSVVAGLDIWFDQLQVLGDAVRHAQAILIEVATSTLLPEQLTASLAALHTSEKCLALGEEMAGQSALLSALGHLAAAQLISSGTLPHKDVWLTPGANELTAHRLYRQAVKGSELVHVMGQAWSEVHALLPMGAQPIVNFLAENGPAPYVQLERAPQLSHLKLTERLMLELVSHGLLGEQTKPRHWLGVDEIIYTE